MGKTRRVRPLRKRSTKRRTKRLHGGDAISVVKELVPSSVNHLKTNYVATNSKGRQIIINGTTISSIEPYFEGTTLENGQQTELLDLFFNRFELKNFYEIQKKVEEAITSLYPFTKPCSKREWKSCSGTCMKILSDLVEKEIGSTAYMIRSLYKSVLWAEKKPGGLPPITLKFKSLTGEWKKDIPLIEMVFNKPNKTSRLIMGFGPSAAGKTYWAQTLVNLFSQTEDFPTTFLSIDGGIYRETSMIYQMIIRTLMRTCTVGFDNLVGSSFMDGSLFEADAVKKQMMEFLKKQPPRLKLSLYVPETLGSCGWKVLTATRATKACFPKYREYIDLTNDSQWIGLLIWQHESGAECSFPERQKCKGCIESGKSREIMEGKKYSSGAYGHSMYKGWKHMTGNKILPKNTNTDTPAESDHSEDAPGAPGGQFYIHNSGGRKTGKDFNITTIVDYTKNPTALSNVLSKYGEQYNYHYSKGTFSG